MNSMKISLVLVILAVMSGFGDCFAVTATASNASQTATENHATYLYGSYLSWRDYSTLETSVGAYKITPAVWLLDKPGTRAGRTPVDAASPLKVRLKFEDKRLREVVIY